MSVPVLNQQAGHLCPLYPHLTTHSTFGRALARVLLIRDHYYPSSVQIPSSPSDNIRKLLIQALDGHE